MFDRRRGGTPEVFGDGTVTVDNPNCPPEAFCESGMNETVAAANSAPVPNWTPWSANR